MKKKTVNTIYISWFLLALFYGFQYFLRVSPSIMGNNLRCQFLLNAEGFALFSAIYLYGYGLFQIPIGFCLDHFGVKKTMTVSIFICFISTILFFLSNNLYLSYFARLLMGIGAAGGLIAPLKIIGDNITDGKKGLFNGMTLTLGTCGALFAGNPLNLLMQEFGCKNAGLIGSLFAFLLCILIFFLMPQSIDNKKREGMSSFFKKIFAIMNNKNLLIYSILIFGSFAPLTIISDTWGIHYLMKKYSLSQDVSAECVAFVFIGLFSGSFLLPAYFEKTKQIVLGIRINFIILLFSFLIFLYVDGLSIYAVKGILFLFGFCAANEMICFTGAASVSKEGFLGLSLGLANTINMVGSAVLQQFIGKMLHLFWSGEVLSNGIPLYTEGDFKMGFSFLILIYFICIFIAFFFLKKEKEIN